MQTYTIRFDKNHQHLIDISCLHPAPVEAFAFLPLENGRVEVSTVDKARYDKWITKLQSQNCVFETVD